MSSTLSNDLFSDIIIHNKYARYLKDQDRRETWEEICERNMTMHMESFPKLQDSIAHVYKHFVLPKKVLPSMRSMQFGGRPIQRNHSRIYNCAYLPASSTGFFSELMFLLLGGTGVGYSVRASDVNQLPFVRGALPEERRYIVGDSIEGWADCVKVVVEAYFLGKPRPRFDYSDIREKGQELVTTGGKAPGPAPLRECIVKVEGILQNCVHTKLTTLQVHDIACHIADAVLAGGIRRAAMIALFDPDDVDMLYCKSGAWYETQPQRGRANNSAVLSRYDTTREQFEHLYTQLQESGSGEPGFLWSNDGAYGTNPCGEISLEAYQFCNLTEINYGSVVDDTDLYLRAGAASFLGTLQAAYTDFHYLNPQWKRTTEKAALIGVGLTGIASGELIDKELTAAAQNVVFNNIKVSQAIGINQAERCTTVKPSGTSSIVLSTSSGVHAWHSPYYLRRVRLNKEEGLYKYIAHNAPQMVEDDFFSPASTGVVTIPQKAPEGALFRDEGAINLFDRAIYLNQQWVKAGHVKGPNPNNCSTTISVKPEEWDRLKEYMWNYREHYNGMTCLPYDGGSYRQAPFEECTKEQYNDLEASLTQIDMRDVVEHEDHTSHTQEAACAGGVCEIK